MDSKNRWPTARGTRQSDATRRIAPHNFRIPAVSRGRLDWPHTFGSDTTGARVGIRRLMNINVALGLCRVLRPVRSACCFDNPESNDRILGVRSPLHSIKTLQTRLVRQGLSSRTRAAKTQHSALSTRPVSAVTSNDLLHWNERSTILLEASSSEAQAALLASHKPGARELPSEARTMAADQD